MRLVVGGGSTMLLPLSLLAASLLGGRASAAETAAPPLRGMAVEEALEGEAVLADALNEALLRAAGLPVVARITLARTELEPTPGAFRFDRLDERIERYKTKGGPGPPGGARPPRQPRGGTPVAELRAGPGRALPGIRPRLRAR